MSPCLKLFLLALAIGMLDGRVGIAATGADEAQTSLRKVVGYYALTSANDFPQRDPQEWRLLGSNDGGKTWMTLDTRKGESFAQRHQRRVFKVTNAGAYDVYRLQIDRVRDPNAANCVQLSEVQPMGVTEADLDPAPVFTDRFSAQGENPPMETVARLFDGAVETKWLDRPGNRTTCASWVQWQYVSPTNLLVTNAVQLLSLRSRALAAVPVKMTGIMTGPMAGSEGLEFFDGTAFVKLRAAQDGEQYSPGQMVKLQGVSHWDGTEASVDLLQVEKMGAPPSDLPPRMALGQTLPRDELKWVEVEGVVKFVGALNREAFLELQEDEQSVQVKLHQPPRPGALPVVGARIVARGICQGAFNDRGEWVLATLWAPGLDSLFLMESGATAARPAAAAERTKTVPAASATLTKIEQIRRLNRDQLALRPKVKVRGVITDLVGNFLQDDTAGVQLYFAPSQTRKISEAGVFVEAEGYAGNSEGGSPVVSVDKVTVLGRGKMPQPERPSLGQLMSGRLDGQWVELEGVVRATDGAHLLLICDGGEVTATIGAASSEVVKGLVDAGVRVRGVGLIALDDRGRTQGVHLLIPSLEHVEVEQTSRESASLPVTPIGRVLGLSGSKESFHQVRVVGTVTLQDGNRLFIRDDSGSAMGIFKEDVILDARFGRSRWLFWRTPNTNATHKADQSFQPGEQVEMVGFPETRGYSPVLTEVTVRKTGKTEVVNAGEATALGMTDGRLDSTLASLEGMMLAAKALDNRVVLEFQWQDRTLQVFVPVRDGESLGIAPGSRLRVTGVFQVESVPYAELGRRVASVKILARSPADLTVLARPSWWTIQRALGVMGGMALVILAASIWITQLHRKVEARSVQLTAEIHRREQIERQRALEEERTRIAQDLHDDLGAALTQIRFLSAVESRDEQVPEGTRQQLKQVSEKSRHLVASLDEIVWAINPANDSLPNLANYLCHVAEEFFLPTTIRCRLDVDDALPAVPLTSEVRHNLYLAVREALNNIAKHSQATEVWLRLGWKEKTLRIEVEDNGRGFAEPATPVGEGLLNMRRRIEKIGGHFECDSRPGTGTTCRLSLRLG